MGPVKQAMDDAKVKRERHREVILVAVPPDPSSAGFGSAVSPAARTPITELNPDEVVALGAAIQAGVLKGEVSDVLRPTSPIVRWCGDRRRADDQDHRGNTTIAALRSEVVHHRGDTSPQWMSLYLQVNGICPRQPGTGRFKLEEHPPAPRGEPRSRSPFASSQRHPCMSTARDNDTAPSRASTIPASSPTSKSDCILLCRAEANRREDEQLRKAFEARNELDSVASQVERRLRRTGRFGGAARPGHAPIVLTPTPRQASMKTGTDAAGAVPEHRNCSKCFTGCQPMAFRVAPTATARRRPGSGCRCRRRGRRRIRPG